MLPPEPLSGRRILVTRSPGRSAALSSALAAAGASTISLPLIDFERARNQELLDRALDGLSEGQFDWLVVSSVTTVQALNAKAEERGATLAAMLPAGTRVAAVGTSTRMALEAAGIHVRLMPEEDDQSAAGLAANWPAGESRILLPQADIAESRLADGIAAKGASVTTVVAYHTVDYPARTALRLGSGQAGRGAGPEGAADSPREQDIVLQPEQARADVEAGLVDAVVAASPSAARRIARMLPVLGHCRFVAIGPSTADAARAAGITVAGTAHQPTPDGIVAALTALFATEGN